MIRRPPISTRTDTLFPYPTLFRSAVVRTVRELAGQAELATTGRGLALDLTLGLALEAFVHPVEDEAEQRAAAVHIVRQEMVEMVAHRSEEHTSELQSLMRISYAVFCLKKKHTKKTTNLTSQ